MEFVEENTRNRLTHPTFKQLVIKLFNVAQPATTRCVLATVLLVCKSPVKYNNHLKFQLMSRLVVIPTVEMVQLTLLLTRKVTQFMVLIRLTTTDISPEIKNFNVLAIVHHEKINFNKWLQYLFKMCIHSIRRSMLNLR